jgi:hypothetical protein
MWPGDRLKRVAIDCTSHAEECRELAKQAPRAEDWGHFLEMAQTWEILAKHRPTEKVAETMALAEAIANGRKC